MRRILFHCVGTSNRVCDEAAGVRWPARMRLSPCVMAVPSPRTPGAGIFRLTYSAPGAIIALPCPLQAFGLHDSNCLNRHTDDALRLPGLVQLEIIPLIAGLCGGFRLDRPARVNNRVSAGQRDVLTTARHMNP